MTSSRARVRLTDSYCAAFSTSRRQPGHIKTRQARFEILAMEKYHSIHEEDVSSFDLPSTRMHDPVPQPSQLLTESRSIAYSVRR